MQLIGSFRLLHENKLFILFRQECTNASAKIALNYQVDTGEFVLLNVCEDDWGGRVDCLDEAEVDKRDPWGH